MDSGIALQVSLVSTPAGYGKTTFLSGWATQCRTPVAWVSLDEGDNDPARFFSYLIEALNQIHESMGRGMPEIVQSARFTRAEYQHFIEKISTLLINQISASPGKMVLVLDDYHVIRSHSVHEAVTYLIDHQPQNLHLVIATRADPPLPVARLRVRGQLNELRAEDLSFSSQETGEFLNRVMELQLNQKEIDSLTQRTEGWIAGLQMASLSLRGRSDLSDFIDSLSGSQRYIMDYLLEEVIRRESDQTQTFLLHTSILDQLCDPLCDAVVGNGDNQVSDSRVLLEYLDRAYLFISPLDDHRH